MRSIVLTALLVLVAVLSIHGAASAQCTAVLADGLFPTGGTVQVGDTIEYLMTVSVPNVSGYCTLYDVDLYFFPPPGEPDPCDNTGGGILIASGLTLTPGGPVYTYTSADHPALSHVVTLADMLDGDGPTISADMATTFLIEGGIPDQQCDESTSSVQGTNPCIEVTKETCGISKVGDEVVYTICVTNCSNPPATLYNVIVTDPMLGGTLPGFPSDLAPDEQVCLDLPYVVQAGDPDPIVNTVEVMAEDEYGNTVTGTGTAEVDLIHPALTVGMECVTPEVPAGGTAEYLITVTNTGDCVLNITADPPIPGPSDDGLQMDGILLKVDRPDIGGPDMRVGGGSSRIFLYPGDTMEWSDSVADPGGVDCIYNEVTVTWTLPPEYCEMPNTGDVSADACCDVVQPCIDVTKDAYCDISKEGDSVIYTICVTNCGDSDLFELAVVDDVIGDLGDYFPDELPMGETVCVDLSYVVTADDPDPLVNTVTVTAENAAGTVVTDYAMEEVDLIHPSVEVTKECLTDQVPSGGTAQYEVVITNTGDCDLVITTTEPEIPGPFTLAAGGVYTEMVTRDDPGGVDCVYNDITVSWSIPPEYCELWNTGEAYAEACCEITQAGCMVIIDEEGLDNDFMTVEQAAARLGVEPDYLINDDRPTEVGNPVLRWNELGVGDIVLLPTGQVDDEGWFALPEEDMLPWTIADYIAGVVPQSQLDEIPDVMPLRNHELIALIGQTCVAVVYDSDISMNYLPIKANLQGARYGLFYFTVLGYEVPGYLPEAGSSSTLVSLWLRVEEPHDPPSAGYHVQVRDHEPDAIEINRATVSGGVLTVWGESDFSPGALMTLSVDGPDNGSDLAVDPAVIEEVMTYNPSAGRYEFVGSVPGGLSGRRLVISTDEGGAYNDYVE